MERVSCVLLIIAVLIGPPPGLFAQKPGKKRVLLDTYFNNEWRKNAAGAPEQWHYTWADTTNGGYYELGKIFQKKNAVLASLKTAPSAFALKNASVYIIVDPDTDKETARPHYISEKDASQIATWVKTGGVLVLLGNDKGNCDLEHLNILSQKFGIRFNEDRQLAVQDDIFEQGQVLIPAGHLIFNTAKTIFLKDICSLTLSGSAKPVLEQNGVTIMAMTKYGKGTVFALGDPWIYNEYIGHRRLPEKFENDKAAADWVNYLLKKTKK